MDTEYITTILNDSKGFETLKLTLSPDEIKSARKIATERSQKGRRLGYTNLVPSKDGDHDFKGAIGELAFSLAIDRLMTESASDRLSSSPLPAADVDRFQVRTASKSYQGLRVRVKDNPDEIYVLVELEFLANELKPSVTISGWTYGHEVITLGKFKHGIGNAPDYYSLETSKLRPIIDLFLEGDYWPSARAKFPAELKKEAAFIFPQPTECNAIQFDLWESTK